MSSTLSKKALAFVDSKPLELLLRVTHNSKGDLGETRTATYDVPVRVDLSMQKIKLINTHFVSRDRPKMASRIGFLIACSKFIVFYSSLCGLMALPTREGANKATQFFVAPAAIKADMNWMESAVKIFKLLREMKDFWRAMGPERFINAVSFANHLEKCRAKFAPYYTMNKFAAGIMAATVDEFDWTARPSELLQRMAYNVEKEFNIKQIGAEDIHMLRWMIEEMFFEKGKKMPKLQIKLKEAYKAAAQQAKAGVNQALTDDEAAKETTTTKTESAEMDPSDPHTA
jgi:hypothetical protein